MIKQGRFPDTTTGCESERFCFVSLDADLYGPTYAGLHWFYPRLASGGYILANDYNTDFYTGVRVAVDKHRQGCPSITIIPIPDMCGSGVIAKPL